MASPSGSALGGSHIATAANLSTRHTVSALERRASKGSYERRKLSEVLEGFRVEPSLDRIRDEC